MAPIQFLINIVSVSLALGIVYWSKLGNFKQFIQYLFEHRKLSTSEAQADHLADIAYYYAIYVISISTLVTFIRFLRGEFNQAVNPDTKFVSSLNKIIVNSSEHFLIFMSIYVYFLQQKGFGLKIDQFLLMPFWFLIGRLGSVLEEILTQATKNAYLFYYFGFIMSWVPYVIMVGQIFGQSSFSFF